MYQIFFYGLILWITDVTCLSSSCASSESCQQLNPTTKMSVSTIGGSIETFGLELYTAISAGQSGNIIISPFSIETCLTLLYCGSSGKTESILQNVLGFQKHNQTYVAQAYQSILKPYQKSNIDVATAIYVDQQYHVQPMFQSLASNDFYSTIKPINFMATTQAVKTMNNWVAAKTHNKITQIVSPNDIEDNTSMVLLNAVYFKGIWETKFYPRRTYPQRFNTGQCTKNEFKKLSMMHMTNNFNVGYVSYLKSNVIQLPYSDSDISMVIILPEKCSGLADVEPLLHLFDFNQINYNDLSYEKVILTMPKFTIDFSITLNKPLQSLGLQNIFGYSANFSNILETPQGSQLPLYVSKMIQKAYIEVDESGTKAAAVTGGFINFMAEPARPPPPPVVFDANHPFVYLLIDSNEILFMGRFTG